MTFAWISNKILEIIFYDSKSKKRIRSSKSFDSEVTTLLISFHGRFNRDYAIGINKSVYPL